MLLATSALFFTACGEQSADVSASAEDVVILDSPSSVAVEVEPIAVTEPVVAEAVAEVVEAVEDVAAAVVTQPVAVPVPAAPVVPAVPVALLEVPESKLIEMLGYLTAQSGGVATLKLDAAGIAALVGGLQKGLVPEVNPQDFPQEAMQAAFGQAQARAEAVQAEAAELPAITLDALDKIGMVMVMQSGLSQLGFGAADAELIAKGFTAGALATEIDPAMEAMMPAFQAFIQPRAEAAQAQAQADQAEAQAVAEKAGATIAVENMAAGQAFIEGLSADAAVQSSASGLYYKILEPGSDVKPTMSDKVLVHYKGTLIDGTPFDSSYDRGEPAEFPLNGVVKGFGEGLTKVGAGGKIVLYIPSELGYGNSPRPGGAIRPGDTLIFECELVEIL
ncbi:MAG: FKBP-type peptidyl-prolyl cis-trans isomerase [Lentimonas sp.]|jgi:FKBP-type peptidyl-prolyl cis-trans isomerase